MGFIVEMAAKARAETETTFCMASIKASELDSTRERIARRERAGSRKPKEPSDKPMGFPEWDLSVNPAGLSSGTFGKSRWLVQRYFR